MQTRKEKLYFFYWRPRPRDLLLSREERADLLKKMYPNAGPSASPSVVSAAAGSSKKNAAGSAAASVFKGVSKLIKQFEAEDYARKNAINTTVLTRRRELASSFFAFLNMRQTEVAAFRANEVSSGRKYSSPAFDDFEIVSVVIITLLCFFAFIYVFLTFYPHFPHLLPIFRLKKRCMT